MKKLTVLVDLDDTLEELCDAWVAWLNNKYGTSVKHEDVTEWDISKFFPSISKDAIYGELNGEEFWETVKPKDGAIKYLKQIMCDGHDVYIVTATHYLSIKPKVVSVLSTYFDFIPWDNVIVTHNKQMIHGDVLIDDGVHNLIGGQYKKILMSAPHNVHMDAAALGMIRADTWRDAYEAICSIASDGACSSYVKSYDLCERCELIDCPDVKKNTPCNFRSKYEKGN